MMARPVPAGLTILLLTSCASGATSTTSAPPSPTMSSSTGAPASPAHAAREPRIVIADNGNATPSTPAQVRLARLDATDVGVVAGNFVGVVDDEVVALNGLELEAMDYDGHATTIGVLASPPAPFAGTVVVSPDLTHWLYTTTPGQSLTAQIHEGSAGGDRVLATIPSPDNNGVFGPYAWNSTGVYVVLNATGIGGAGPFLEYHFPLYRFDLATGGLSKVVPDCYAYAVLASGTLVCAGRPGFAGGGLEIRFAGGRSTALPVQGQFAGVRVSRGEQRLALAYEGGTSTLPAYQIGVAALAATSLTAFGPAGYFPEAWLPDGRLIAEQSCLFAYGPSPLPCESSPANGTRVLFSADGSSSTPFYKLSVSSRVGGVLA